VGAGYTDLTLIQDQSNYFYFSLQYALNASLSLVKVSGPVKIKTEA